MIDNDINPFMNDEFDLNKRMQLNQLNSTSSCSIGTVVAINSSPVSVDIQPSIKYFDREVGFVTSPVLKHIPLAQIANSSSSIKLPLNPGDVGVILWFDREVYSWLDSSSAGSLAPGSGTFNNDSACIFIPLIQKFSQAPVVKNTGMDFISSGQSLMTQLLEELQALTTLLTSLTTFNTALIVAGAPYAGPGGSTAPMQGAYAIAVTAAATVLNTAISAVGSSLASVATALTTFKGAQTP